MKSLQNLSLLLGLYFTVTLGSDSKDRLPTYLRFKHTRFSFAIKERHSVGQTREQLTAFGCGDTGIKYAIQENRIPFKIHPDTGRISLTERLNYVKSHEYSFIVEAVANNEHCKNQKAITLVKVIVIQHNAFRPQFKDEKYYCRIQEETGHVKISPEIKVFDKDQGPAGKISQVQVWETEQPFVLELEESTGIVTVMAKTGYKFDASRMSKFRFSLQAWDDGDPPRNSPPIKIHCTVIPQNRHSPVFKKKMYVGRVKQGEASSNIVQVRAKDSDTYETFGKICEYFIRTSDMPFHINKKGVISLPRPLGDVASDTYVFTVMAKDCGGRISEEATTVNIIVDKDCTPGFEEPENRSPLLKNCDGMVRVIPKARLNMCGESRQYADFSANVTMETAHILKGCDRETYEASGVFKMCNVNNTVDLLPSTYRAHTWMAGVMGDESIIGENVYHFNKKTAIDVPSYVLAYTGDQNMTISTWIWMQKQDSRQFIIAASDPQRLDRKHFGLFTEGEKLVFIHRQESSVGTQEICQSVFTWKPNIFDTHWHHVLVTVTDCQTTKLFVDSKEVPLFNSKENWPLHGSNMAYRIVIGARWSGREQNYDDYFEGYLGGLSVNFGEHIDKQAINCVYECKEQIKLDSPAPSGFQVKQKDHKIIEISGKGTPESFEKMLQSLVYVNTRLSPTNGRRPLQIHTTINKQPLPMLSLEIAVSATDDETAALKLSGSTKKVVGLLDLQKYGIRVAEKLTITSDKCSKYLDSARVEVVPPLSSDESLVNPGPMLDVLNLKKDVLPNGKGLVIRGLATIDEYKMVLREIVFVHLGLENRRDPSIIVYHKFKFTVSNLKNRYVSNVLQTELTTDKTRQFDMQALGRQQKDALPGEVDEGFVGKSSGSSLGVLIGVIVAASCVFVFVILVVIVRLQSAKNVYVSASQKVDETAGQKDCRKEEGLNVTMNPLEKFETTGDQAESQETSNPSGGKTLEWDDAYIA